MKPVYQTRTPDNQITSQIRPLHTNTTTDNRPDPTTKLDHQITPPPPIQTTSSDHPNRPQDTILDYSASNQHSIPSLLKWYRSGAFFVGLGRGGYIELWMNLAKHTFHTRSARSFRTLRLKLIVVRLASGFPGLVRASPSLSLKMGSFAGVRSAIRFRLLAIGSAFWIWFGI